MISNGSTVSDVKQDLSSRTGLLLENIQFNQGQEELPDSTVINPTSALPYFLFNKWVKWTENALSLHRAIFTKCWEIGIGV